MLVKMTCSRQEVNEYVEYGESQGLQLNTKSVIDKDQVELIFSTSGKEAAIDFVERGAEAFLEFQDGSTSPLYIRQSRDFSE